jgi:hypothetical protein
MATLRGMGRLGSRVKISDPGEPIAPIERFIKGYRASLVVNCDT